LGLGENALAAGEKVRGHSQHVVVVDLPVAL